MAPLFALRLLFGEMANAVLDGQKAIPENLLQPGFTFQFSEPGPALTDIWAMANKFNLHTD
jgi:NAD dependent epimerase/dehydratase family enzyme